MQEQYYINSLNDLIAAYRENKLTSRQVKKTLQALQCKESLNRKNSTASRITQPSDYQPSNNLQKPSNIALVPVRSSNFATTDNSTCKDKPIVTLASLNSRYSTGDRLFSEKNYPSEYGEIKLVDYGSGVYALITNTPSIKASDESSQWSPYLIQALEEGFGIVRGKDDARVLLIEGGEQLFLPNGLDENSRELFFSSELAQLPLRIEVPVIAVVKGDSEGLAWLWASLCDFMICAEESAYRFSSEGTEDELRFIEARFNVKSAHALLLSRDRHTGKELVEAGLGMAVVGKQQIKAYALRLAHKLSKTPKNTLVLLKQHLSGSILHSAEKMASSFKTGVRLEKFVPSVAKETIWEEYCAKALSHPDNHYELKNAEQVPISSPVVNLRIFPNGVGIIRLEDREGKNTFTEALLEGISDAFQKINNDMRFKVVILTGYDHYFACGGTKESLLAIQSGTAKFTDSKVYSLPLESPIPVISAMQGHGIGAGWSMGMFSDCVIFSEQHVYNSPYIKYGFTPGAGSTLVFPQKLGMDLGREILFFAEDYKGVEIQRRYPDMPVVATSRVVELAEQVACDIAKCTRQELEQMKRDSSFELRSQVQKIFAREQAMHEKCFVNNDEVLQRINEHFNDGIQSDIAINKEVNKTAEEDNQDESIIEEIRFTLRSTLAEELLIEQSAMDDDMKFIEIGLDSVTGVSWVRKINSNYGMSINATKIYNYPTIKEFADYILIQGRKQGLFQVKQPSLQDNKISSEKIEYGDEPLEVKSELSLGDPQMKSVVRRLPSTDSDEHAKEHTKVEQEHREPVVKIAVVGMSGQFPKANDLNEFWTNIAEGRDCISEIPDSRWDINTYYDPNPEAAGKTYSKWMGVLDDVAAFDSWFFNISPREAEWMDPQQRLFLQNAWHCIEDAGYNSERMSGSKCGVFVGCGPVDYGQSTKREKFNSQYFMGKAVSILSAKISYILNLQGPCLTIDTACSSSLVAIASACDSLILGSSDSALVGGVCVMAGPDMHIMTSKAGMLSPDGHCYTFDQNANGFVPGEGVGVLMLKRLEDAERDGDTIHAVISGWGVNQDGKTNGITAPNQDAQARLEKQVYEKYGINPENIQLVEAHGTGTKLGDPIEVEALKESFSAFTSKTHYCALGSVKSNIGHLLAAAGVAGAIKLVLCLKHRQIPPTIHYDNLNEHIELENSPFYINTDYKPWSVPENQKRRGVVSSFGFSGTNAHLVIEDFEPQVAKQTDSVSLSNPVAFILSAKNDQRLKEYAKRLLEFIGGSDKQPINLVDLTYTLQLGRDMMEQRLAISTNSIDDLKDKLQAYLSGNIDKKDLYCGQANQENDAISLLEQNAELKKVAEDWVRRNQLSKIMDLWVKGFNFDWSKLYEQRHRQPTRISLPGYPFENKSYWLEEDDIKTSQSLMNGSNISAYVPQVLHPLLHKNTSTLFSEQRYSSSFSGDEFFFADHIIQGRKVLPGVGHLEMVRAAVKEACGVDVDTNKLTIRNVVWMRPIVGPDQGQNDKAMNVHVSLLMDENGEIKYKIFGGENEQETVIYSQGVVLLQSTEHQPGYDMAHLQAECTRAEIDADQYFSAMKDKGADLRTGFQGITKFYLGADTTGRSQVLTRISIPDSLAITPEQFILHPTAMDAAVHTFPPLLNDTEDFSQTPLALPFALDELEVLDKCQSRMWALARHSHGSTPGGQVSKYDIDLCNDEGRICVRFKGFSVRTLDKNDAKTELSSEPGVVSDIAAETLMIDFDWTAQPAAVENHVESKELSRVVILCDLDHANAVRNQLDASRVEILSSKNTTDIDQRLDQGYLSHAQKVFSFIKGIFLERSQDKGRSGTVFIQLVVRDERVSGLAGLLKTMQLENPKLLGQLIVIEPHDDLDTVVKKIDENYYSPEDQLVRYRRGVRQVLEPSEIDLAQSAPVMPWKEHGVYLITGGAGSLGMIFAEEITRQLKNARIILTGRSALSQDQLSRLDSLTSVHGNPSDLLVEYRQVDVTVKTEVETLIRDIINKYGKLSGIIHGAGINHDNYIPNKTEEEITEVLAPKVAGTINLDLASRHLDLDFFVLFSSIASAIGNTGQADYAMANAFLDAYARYRNELAETLVGAPSGQSLAINWPLWEQGGMPIDDQTERWMKQNTGMIPMNTRTGIQAFYRALSSGKSQVMVTEGDKKKMTQWVLHSPEVVTPSSSMHVNDTVSLMDGDQSTHASSLQVDNVLEGIKPVVAKILKIGPNEIDIDKELNNHGFDSITLTELTNDLNKTYNIPSSRALNPTLFFEHPTMRSFAQYLAEESEDIRAVYAQTDSNPEVIPNQQPAEKKKKESTHTQVPSKSFVARARQPVTNADHAEISRISPVHKVSESNMDIAVVGMSGRLPMANDIYEFWQNLVDGKDCISVVPSDRWDWKKFYGDPTQEGNKTDIKWGGFIDGVEEFDPLFFGISPREALLMDPMQRLLMQHTWQAIEDAGYSANSLSGTRTAIFVGSSVSEYSQLLARAKVPFDAFLPTGRSASLGANRMSYILNINGPSETVDTACSSSLVAIHRAVVSMKNGHCDMALVGGVNTILAPDGHVAFRKAGMLCEDGRCKTFSKDANGYVRGEGVGILFLKKLSDAEKAGDHIYGVIKASGENHGGRANSLTAPNPVAQAELLKSVYTEASIDPRSVGYIEAHGTGTPLGDPVEVNGLKMAFKDLYKATGDASVTETHCGLGSAKSNIGHLELAAGAAGAIKVLLQLKHKTLVKSLHCEEINPYIQLQGTPFRIIKETQDWAAINDAQGNALPRRAGVSSFGFGGANAHIVFEEYLGSNKTEAGSTTNAIQNAKQQLIVLSAKNAERLQQVAKQLLYAISESKIWHADGWTERYRDADLADIAYTLQVGRVAMDERLGIKVSSLQELREKLERYLAGETSTDIFSGKIARNNDLLALFSDDDELQEAVEKWASRNKINKLLSLWVEGYDFDWYKLYRGSDVMPRRISLPVYPFAKQRHWPDTDSSSDTSAPETLTQDANLSQANHHQELTGPTCFVKKIWHLDEAKNISPDSLVGQKLTDNATVLVLATEETISLAAHLSMYIQNCQIFNFSDSIQLASQLKTFTESAENYAGCIDLVGCGHHSTESLDWISWLQQLIGKTSSTDKPMMLLCVTRGLEYFMNESVNLAGASRVGLYRMLQSEYSKLRSRHLDVDPTSDDSLLAKQITVEWLINSEQAHVCYRMEKRYLPVLQEQASPGDPRQLTFSDDQVLWITGGTRGIGLLCAQHFVEKYGVKKLVLSGRECIPPREQWQDYLANQRQENSTLIEKIKALANLEEKGVQILTLSISLSDEKAIRASINHITSDMGAIHGVIHCAGLNDWENPAFVRKTVDGIQRVLQPKVDGLDVMVRCLQDEPLELFVLFSSVAAVIPSLGAGQSDYAMANAYMDYVAEAHQCKRPIVSIQWPSWKETGMGEANTQAYKNTGLLSLSDEDGLQLLDQVLSHSFGAVVLPALVNPTVWKAERLMQRSITEDVCVTSKQPDVAHGSATDSLPIGDSEKLLQATLKWISQLFSKELMIAEESLDAKTPFADYGVDSIMLVQLLRRIQETLNADRDNTVGPLDPSILFEHPTLAAFSAWLVETYPQVLSRVLDESGSDSGAPTEAEKASDDSIRPTLVSTGMQSDTTPSTSQQLEQSVRASRPESKPASSDIAVIGLSCQFPGAGSLDEYWTLLSEGRSAIGPVPTERWGHVNNRYAGLIGNVTHFDPGFFLIADEDARAMDPQALLLLEESLKVFHHAGYSLADVKGSSTGVLIGARSNHHPEQDELSRANNPIIAVGQNYLAANISQYFDLQGPCMVSDTACSSALVNMNIAIQYLQAGDIDAALVGGISLLQTDAAHHLFEQRNILSKDSAFHIFDQRANGVVLGEGVGMVLLKKLEQARADGDQIYAVIKGIAINNDGRTAGHASPNLQAQKAVMQKALQKSGKSSHEISYVELNGSGSEVTDLLEIKAVEALYRPKEGSQDSQLPCELGSMEPNIGHPLCAKGIASFIKAVLMLSHRRRVPFLSGQQAMTHYDIDASPFYFRRESEHFNDDQQSIAINCFADGGTNAHVVLETWKESFPREIRRFPTAPPELNRREIFSVNETEKIQPVWAFEPSSDPARLLVSIKHPILKNHKAYGQELLPGLAYIDVLYQYFKLKGYSYKELELRNLSIYSPLIVSKDYDVLLDIQCEQGKEGVWQIRLEGHEKRGEHLSSDKKRYAAAEMHRVGPVHFGEILDSDEIERSASTTLDLEDLYLQCARQSLNHSGFIKAEGQVFEGSSSTCIDIAVGKDAALTASGYMFHPTLIDGSSVGAQRLFASLFEGEDRLILPLFYESFRATELLQGSCMTRIKTSSLRRKNELLYMNLEFFNSAGNKVAALNNYACKLVRDEGAINPSRKVSKEVTDIINSRPLENAEPSMVMKATAAENVTADNQSLSVAEDFLVDLMADTIDVSADEIDTQLGYYELGLDSASLLDLVGKLENKVGDSLAPTLLFEYTNIEELSLYLTGKYPAVWQQSDQQTVTNGGKDSPQRSNNKQASKENSIVGMDSRMTKFPDSKFSDNLVNEDIAIIGMAGRYPGANNLQEFWENLKAGKDCVTEIPSSRWGRSPLDGIKSPSGKDMSKWGGFIDNADCFDAKFFRVSPWEAKLLDPQQRLFLEVCWETIENAGYTPDTLVSPRGHNKRHDVGVYVGVMHNDYAMLAADAVARGDRIPISLNYAQIANRVSYFCNFHGPSMAVDTVCSSSLIAVHMAIESIRHGECEVALAGGVNLSIHPNKYMTYGMMDMHSSDGRCRAFGADGDGYVSGEGIGAVLLKPLSRSIEDRDEIYAVIKGSTTNHVGAVSGLTVPSPVAQADMIETCLEKTGIHPRTISYMEAHGTGTSLGDPIEIQGLTKAFGRYTDERQFCSIGSVKSNIGHAESAAGISGLSKLVLQLYHKTLVPSLHSSTLNPYLDFENSPFYVQQKTEHWQQPVVQENGQQVHYPRRAALSSFGASGSNAHVILEEYVPNDTRALAYSTDSSPDQYAKVIPLSAKNSQVLHDYAERLLDYLKQSGEDNSLTDLAYTLQVGRVQLEERVAFVADSIERLINKIEAFVAGQTTQNGKDEYYYRGTVKKGKKNRILPELEHSQETLKNWLSTGSAYKIAQYWVKGVSIDWETIYYPSSPQTAPHRIGLPTYPFAKERYWLDAEKNLDTIDTGNVEPTKDNTELARSDGNELVYFSSVWKPHTQAVDIEAVGKKPEKITLFVATNNANNIIEKIQGFSLADQVIQLAIPSDTASQVRSHTIQLFQYCRNPGLIKNSRSELLLVYVPYTGSDYPYRSLMGALRTISLELPFIKCRLVFDEALASNSVDTIQRNLQDEIKRRHGFSEIIYAENQPVQVLTQEIVKAGTEAPAEYLRQKHLIRQNGVYLITGGLGGLGRLFAEHLGKGTEARFILTGRSRLSEDKKRLLHRLQTKGVDVEYLSCNASDKAEVNKIIDHVLEEYGALHGVIHSAGLISDNFIPKKTEQEINEVLSAKVDAIINLDQATRNIDLDFFVSFSSVASLGNVGQLDYASANAFLDVFASYRQSKVLHGERYGKSLSINWPLWEDGGMTVDKAYEEFMYENFGVVPLKREHGIDAFIQALLSTHNQFGVMQGNRQKISGLLTGETGRDQANENTSDTGSEGTKKTIAAELESEVQHIVIQAIADSLEMDADAVDLQVEFVDYGMDSIAATKVANYINRELNLDYTGAIFLELDTAEKLINHLLENDVEDTVEVESETVEENSMDDAGLEKTDDSSLLAQIPLGLGVGKIGIIGFDARLPGAVDEHAYWKNLEQKAVSIRKISTQQWQKRGVVVESEDSNSIKSMQYSALIDDVDMFDAEFWGIPRETAKEMDPQQRLLMQSIWHCVEEAGYSMKQLTQKKVGLFLAIDSQDYRTALRSHNDGIGMGAGISVGMIANQISYYCNFKGPSEVIDNACASTYVALKRATQSIALGECELAIVGAAKIMLDPLEFKGREEGGILSHSGVMYPFDSKADGYIRGEGVGCVLLKPLDQAAIDKNSVNAVIAGIGVSHNGRNSLSQVAPNVEGQYQAIRKAYEDSGVEPETVNYIEGHGTSNNFSDSAEVAAFKHFFKDALDPETYRNHRCAISTVKGNTGHLEGASGIASLIKVLCAIKHKKIPANATLTEVHPSILINNSPFYFPTSLTDWDSVKTIAADGSLSEDPSPRRVGLHSVGIGGVNAHMILEEYTDHPGITMSKESFEDPDEEAFELVVFSAKSKQALAAYCNKWNDYLSGIQHDRDNKPMKLSDIAYSSQIGREAMPYRVACVVDSIEALQIALAQGIEGIDQRQSESVYVATNLDRPILKEASGKQQVTASHSIDSLKALADAWLGGQMIDWKQLWDHKACHFIRIPSYPFQEQSIWYSDREDTFAQLFYETYMTKDGKESLSTN